MNIERLKDLREDHDYKQEVVAQYLGIKQQQYSEYESGKVAMPIERYSKIADFYNTSIDYIIGKTDERKPYPKSILKK